MIRRELNLADGTRLWLLISQVEHARIGGELARHWTAMPQVNAALRNEILEAIAHHDDGWANWDDAPPIDPAHGRPYSFMNEMPLGESLAIWDDSISTARAIGPLAGWMVASHFNGLLKDGKHTDDPRAIDWLEKNDTRRDNWLRQWLAADKRHSAEIADCAVRLLRGCDFLSLWLCCDVPVAVDEICNELTPFELHWPEATFRFMPLRTLSDAEESNERLTKSGWSVVGQPWPFVSEGIEMTADAWSAPVHFYNSIEKLMAVRRRVLLRWRLVQRS